MSFTEQEAIDKKEGRVMHRGTTRGKAIREGNTGRVRHCRSIGVGAATAKSGAR